ncbi:hypothetical protein Leryth_009377 [Lithospermum erythrorhizon]|nr:hypothetical protein Leryth_009377 [Lithospermum erythrorhizon]
MKVIQTVFRSASGLSHRLRQQQSLRAFATSLNLADDDKQSSGLFGTENDKQSTNSLDSEADFEQRIFSGSGDSLKSSSFYRQMDRARNNNDGGLGLGSGPNNGGRAGTFDDLDVSFTSLSDGVDTKLMNAARYFEYDSEEVEKDDYAFRPDVTFRLGDTYEPKDLDLTKPGIQKPFKRRSGFETTTEEVLRKADFRNVRFLANFITEAGILIKRSQTGISAKAQRKVAREIKTARAFGLMPFTTMGSKQFVFGRTMESLGEDYEYEASVDTSFVEDT